MVGPLRRFSSDTVRRLVDVVVAVSAMVTLSPVMALSMVAVRVDIGSSVIFRQQRLGRGGVPFTLYKLRSMRDPAPGREAPQYDNERTTRLGRFLRSTSLDELPSLWNLLRGDITLVGPRPLPVSYWERFHGEQYRRFDVKPGMTGLAQVAGRNHVDWPTRLTLDVQHVDTRSLRGDLRILLATVPLVLRRHGVDDANGVTMHELPHQGPGTAA